jgi:hypothetical protein
MKLIIDVSRKVQMTLVIRAFLIRVLAYRQFYFSVMRAHRVSQERNPRV